jgi:hypothetical protein
MMKDVRVAHKRARVLLWFAAVSLIAAGIGILFMRPHEPMHDGRKLSEWVELYSGHLSDQTGKQAAVAIRGIGADALPHLVNWVAYERPAWHAKLGWFLDGFARKLNPTWTRSDRYVGRALDAAKVFALLGPEARGAVEPLSERLETTKDPNVARRLIYALVHCGPDALPPVLATLTNQQALARDSAARWIHELGTNASPAIPTLVQCLQDKEPRVAADAARSLGVLNMEPALVVPALGQSLRHTDDSVRFEAASALKQFGKEGRPAVPELVKALSDPNPTVRTSVTNALSVIDRAALEKYDPYWRVNLPE